MRVLNTGWRELARMRVTILLDEEEVKILKKRAKENLLSLKEQIEDIVRRSCVSAKRKQNQRKIKVDDKLVGIFSREKRGRKKK
jgi:hypothetical protein